LKEKSSSSTNVYKPSEDSFLLARAIESEINGGSVLEVGCGSGVVTEALASRARFVVATDINFRATAEAKSRVRQRGRFNVELICCDIARPVRMLFDVVVCNPPYLPAPREEFDATVEGGREGSEFVEKLINETMPLLQRQGKILFTYSSWTNIEKIRSAARKLNLEYEVVLNNRLFFEQLFVARLVKSLN
jgi:release factor glutamine methyltransferase